MSYERMASQIRPELSTNRHDEANLDDLLQELRILLQGVQVLTAFLIFLPFNEGFAKIDQMERWVYLATFICALASLVMFTAPAAYHRLVRPVPDRARFNLFATRMTIAGMIPLSLSLILATHLVVSEVIGDQPATATAALVAVLIGVLWWLLPMARKVFRRA